MRISSRALALILPQGLVFPIVSRGIQEVAVSNAAGY